MELYNSDAKLTDGEDADESFVCLIRVIEFGGSDQSGCSLHVYQAPTVITYTHII